jgi:hypothetical protein
MGVQVWPLVSNQNPDERMKIRSTPSGAEAAGGVVANPSCHNQQVPHTANLTVGFGTSMASLASDHGVIEDLTGTLIGL